MIKCNYKQNKLEGAYCNESPSMTDQAGADQTHINVILKQMRITGQVTGHNKEHIEADFSLLPSDLRSMIELTREISQMRNRLPRELRDYTPEQLDSLTAEQLTAILTPPAPTPDTKDEAK